jgi:hypothetical protein
MTKKDYQLIADMIATTRTGVNSWTNGNDALDDLVGNLGFAFALDNPRFDRDKFEAACE